MSTRRRGLYVAFTGIDGAGKSTQAGCLRKALADSGLSAFLYESKEEFVIQIMESIAAKRGAPSARDYFGSRWLDSAKCFDVLREHLTVIRPIVESGRTVVASRSGYCRLAIARMHGFEDTERLAEIVLFAGVPDLTFWMDLPPHVAARRVSTRGIDHEDVTNLSRFRDVLAAMHEEYNWIRVDASRDRDEISAFILGRVKQALSEANEK